jgi:hypothetical protein
LGSALTVDEIYRVGVDDAVVLTLNFKVVGNQVDGATGNNGVGGLRGGCPETARVTARRVAASSFLLGLVFTGITSAWGSSRATHVRLHGVLALRLVVSLVVVHVLGVSRSTGVTKLILPLAGTSALTAHVGVGRLACLRAGVLWGVGVGLVVSVV